MGLFSRSPRRKPQLSQLEATTRFLQDYSKRFVKIWPQVFEQNVRPAISETSVQNPDLFNGVEGIVPSLFCYAGIAVELNAVRNLRSQEEAQHIEDITKVALAWNAEAKRADDTQMRVIALVLGAVARVLRRTETSESTVVRDGRTIDSLSTSKAQQTVANAPQNIIDVYNQLQNLVMVVKEYGIKKGVLNSDDEPEALGYAMFQILDCIEWTHAPSIACVGLGAGVIMLTGGWWKPCFENYEVVKE